ncbi:MAG: amidohydrolase [Proteobacteria bacterium]|nr:amidohydrolase [Pseudomonadota bacterium]
MEGKVVLEEHFSTERNNALWNAKGEEDRNGVAYARDVERRLLDPDACLREMDRAGVEMCILSLTSPGVQGVVDPHEALALARASNDHAHALTRKHPGRFAAFAAVPMQEPQAAADELARAVGELGLKGALINGYSNVGPDEAVQYLDEDVVLPFWDRVAALNVPVYLHPREQLPSQQRAIRGYPELGGSAWCFAIETSTHAVRLMLSGLFDIYPGVQVILGHLGEGLPFMLPRLQHRLDEQREGRKGAKAAHRPSHYFARNFHITTSGHFHTKQLRQAIAQIGAERVLFSIDYPYEQMDVGGRWFDDLELEDGLKASIGRANANRLFSLGLPEISAGAVAGSAS